MSELAPRSRTVVEPPPPRAPSVTDGAPVPVLAEGTAPAAIRYQPPRRRVWPFAAAALALVATGAIAYATHAKRESRRDLEGRYPIAVTDDEQAQLATGAARWSHGKHRLLANLATFEAPDLATLKGIGACTLQTRRSDDELARADSPSDDEDLAVSLRHVIAPGEPMTDLASIARPAIDQLITAAERERFETVAGKDHILYALGGAFVVVRVDEMREPELDRAHDAIAPGVLAGTAYAFDPGSGELRCAGSFRATSSSAIRLSSFSGLDSAREAAIRDFATQVETSIASSLRSID
jgi:hypothetical protein